MEDTQISKVQTDLSKVNERSIASLITKNDAIVKKSCETGSVSEIYSAISKIFEDAALNTTATRRLLENIRKSRTATRATFIVYNSMMAGCGLSVN